MSVGFGLVGKAKSLAELDNADWVTFAPPFDDTPDGPSRRVREVSRKSSRGDPRSVVQCTDTGAILNLLAEADFLAVTSRLRLALSPWRDILQPFDIKLSFPPMLVHLYYRADAQFGPVAAAMIAAVKAEAKKIAFSERRK